MAIKNKGRYKKTLKTCVVCSSEYIARTIDSKFCSNKCSNWYKNNDPEIKDKQIKSFLKTKCWMNHKRCKKCGTFRSTKKKHKCKSVKLKGKRFCFCCGNKLKNHGWEKYTEICGRCGKITQREAERKFKNNLKKQFGGECEKCGYNKEFACLEFHHKNKGEKENRHFYKEILKDPKKFSLLCNRCHRELEMRLIRKKKKENNKDKEKKKVLLKYKKLIKIRQKRKKRKIKKQKRKKINKNLI